MRLVDNDLDYESMTPREVRRFNKNKEGPERQKGICEGGFKFTDCELCLNFEVQPFLPKQEHKYLNFAGYFVVYEVGCTAPVHFFKSYYGRVDATNTILAVSGMDRKTRRKTLRVFVFTFHCI